jgi:hypothetical protein
MWMINFQGTGDHLVQFSLFGSVQVGDDQGLFIEFVLVIARSGYLKLEIYLHGRTAHCRPQVHVIPSGEYPKRNLSSLSPD